MQAVQVRKSQYVAEAGVDYDPDKHSTCTVYQGTMVQQVAIFIVPPPPPPLPSPPALPSPPRIPCYQYQHHPASSHCMDVHIHVPLVNSKVCGVHCIALCCDYMLLGMSSSACLRSLPLQMHMMHPAACNRSHTAAEWRSAMPIRSKVTRISIGTTQNQTGTTKLSRQR